MFLKAITDLKEVEWGRQYLWDIQFPNADLPTPFNTWFPASEIEENLATLETFQFEAYMSTYKVPKSTTDFDLKITFYDDQNYSVSNWITEWVNSYILNLDKVDYHIALLEEAVRAVDIKKMNARKEEVSLSRYFVFPTGGLYFNGTSESGAPQYTVEFCIAGSASRQIIM